MAPDEAVYIIRFAGIILTLIEEIINRSVFAKIGSFQGNDAFTEADPNRVCTASPPQSQAAKKMHCEQACSDHFFALTYYDFFSFIKGKNKRVLTGANIA
jgi:hypothetical protein